MFKSDLHSFVISKTHPHASSLGLGWTLKTVLRFLLSVNALCSGDDQYTYLSTKKFSISNTGYKAKTGYQVFKRVF